jgi:hypothetical protein
MYIGLGAATIAAGMAFPIGAHAASFLIDFGSALATFQAPLPGGPISGLVVTLGGVTFDGPAVGFGAPSYDPVFNDLSTPGPGGSFSYWGGTAGCPEPLCVLEFEDRHEIGGDPPVWAANTESFGTVLASGSYEITPAPIPLPAPLALLAVGLGALGAIGLRRGRVTSPQGELL